MSRKACKRRVRAQSEPALIRLANNPEIAIAERLAIQAMRGGWSDYQNSYRVLADCHGLLAIGTRKKKDASLDGIIQGGMVAMRNIYDRYISTKKVGATGDELAMLEHMVDVSEDFWKRQSAAALETAIHSLKFVRAKQIAANKERLVA